MKKVNLLFSLLAISLLMASCEKEEPEIPNEEELITTLNYTLTPDGTASVVTPGGELVANTTYTGAMELLNESESPVESITDEIREEDDEHQFFFQSTVDGLSVAYNDMDDDGNPLGLATTLTTGAAGSGSLTVILRHEPVKSADGVAEGDITNADGETDIEVVFPIEVK